MKNKKHIAMRCNKEQFEAIKPKLKGKVKFNSVTDFKEYNYLVNCDSNMISNISKGLGFAHVWDYVEEIHEEWNEKIFLEACGIEIIPTLEEVKEYFENAKEVVCLSKKKTEDISIGITEEINFDLGKYWVRTEKSAGGYGSVLLWSKKKGYAKILTYKTPKFEITKEQILELYNTGNPKPDIRKMFPEVFKKLNGWASDSLRINKNWLGYYENSILKYGVDSEGQWFVSESKSKIEECKTNIKATPEEVTEALKKEAVRRGFVEGVSFLECKRQNGSQGSLSMCSGNYYFNTYEDGEQVLLSSGRALFCNGIWATVIKTKTIQQAEELLKELGHEIKIVS